MLLCCACITTLIFTISFTKLQWSSVYASGSAVGPRREFKSPTKAFCVHLKCHIQSVTQNWMSFYFRVVDGLTFPHILPCPKWKTGELKTKDIRFNLLHPCLTTTKTSRHSSRSWKCFIPLLILLLSVCCILYGE